MISGTLQYSQMRLALAATIEYLECIVKDLDVVIAVLQKAFRSLDVSF